MRRSRKPLCAFRRTSRVRIPPPPLSAPVLHGETKPMSWDEAFSERYDEWAAGMTADVAFYVELARSADGPLVELAVGNGRVAIPVARATGRSAVGGAAWAMPASVTEPAGVGGRTACALRPGDRRHAQPRLGGGLAPDRYAFTQAAPAQVGDIAPMTGAARPGSSPNHALGPGWWIALLLGSLQCLGAESRRNGRFAPTRTEKRRASAVDCRSLAARDRGGLGARALPTIPATWEAGSTRTRMGLRASSIHSRSRSTT